MTIWSSGMELMEDQNQQGVRAQKEQRLVKAREHEPLPNEEDEEPLVEFDREFSRRSTFLKSLRTKP